MWHKEIRFIPYKKRKDAEMQFKGFTIRSMASAINQRQGSSGIRSGLRVQNEPLKQQVESPLFSEQSRRVQTGERVNQIFFFFTENAEQNQQYFIKSALFCNS